jgi:4-hydroxy-tetrahydrodipicolinate synthase
MSMKVARPLSGIIPPAVTPLLDGGSLDVSGLERVIERMLGHGVHGVFVLGTTGEGPSLSRRLRSEVMREACRIVDGRVPVLAGVLDSSTAEMLALAECAAASGCSGVVVAPPFYFDISQAELAAWLDRVLEHFPLPVFLYNIPALTKVAFGADVVLRASENPNVHGFKDSSGDLAAFASLRQQLPDEFACLWGPEEFLADALEAGADGGIPGGANLYPELFVKLFRAREDKNWEDLEFYRRHVLELSEGVYQPAGYLRGLKCALSLISLTTDVLAEPFSHVSEPERSTIAETVRALGIK